MCVNGTYGCVYVLIDVTDSLLRVVYVRVCYVYMYMCVCVYGYAFVALSLTQKLKLNVPYTCTYPDTHIDNIQLILDIIRCISRCKPSMLHCFSLLLTTKLSRGLIICAILSGWAHTLHHRRRIYIFTCTPVCVCVLCCVYMCLYYSSIYVCICVCVCVYASVCIHTLRLRTLCVYVCVCSPPAVRRRSLWSSHVG